MNRGRQLPRAWRPLPLLGLWICGGLLLSAITGRVHDWFDMTDELRYERLAISIARTHSLVPRIHGVDVQSFAQLYPLLIAPLFSHGATPHNVLSAHVANAWIMTSACIPAYLLARRVVGTRLASFVAVLSMVMPWIVYSTMLMTEVAAYPAFLWALLALQWATVKPSLRGDLVAIAGLVLAFSGRTELLALVFVPPPAILAYELGRAGEETIAGRLKLGLRNAIARHRLLTIFYVAVAVSALVADIAGKLSGVVGVYGIYAQQNTLFPAGIIGSFATHVSMLALGFGILPFLVGASWLLANILRPAELNERHAFACVSGMALLAILFQGTNFDVRYTGFVHDRFLLYLVPPILIGMGCALEDARLPRRSLAIVSAIAICGFATGSFPGYTWQQFATMTQDSPMSSLLRPMTGLFGSLNGTKAFLAVSTGVLAVLFAAGSRRLRRDQLAILTGLFAVCAMSTITIETFAHFFRTNDWASRPVTSPMVDSFNWIDDAVGTNAKVTQIPYLVNSDYFISEQTWRDAEFWNKSLVSDVLDPGGDTYAYTGIWFPKLDLALDPATGRANISPTSWVAESDKDTRFALAGTSGASSGDVHLLKAVMPWRAQWMSFGLYDDGWTKPHVTARIRIFPVPGQRRPQTRTFAFAVHAADEVASQQVHIVSNLAHWDGPATNTGTTVSSLSVCVPAHGFTEIRISTSRVADIPSEQSVMSNDPRRGGVFFGETAMAGEVGGPCTV